VVEMVQLHNTLSILLLHLNECVVGYSSIDRVRPICWSKELVNHRHKNDRLMLDYNIFLWSDYQDFCPRFRKNKFEGKGLLAKCMECTWLHYLDHYNSSNL